MLLLFDRKGMKVDGEHLSYVDNRHGKLLLSVTCGGPIISVSPTLSFAGTITKPRKPPVKVVNASKPFSKIL